MIVLHTLVDHGHDDIRVAGAEFPGRPHISVGADQTGLSEDRAGVVVVPLHLLDHPALVERELFLAAGRQRHRSD